MNRRLPMLASEARSRWRLLLSAVMVLLLVSAGIVTGSGVAANASATTVAEIKFSKEPVEDQELSELSVKWEVPGTATNPVTVDLALPTELKGLAQTFNMAGPDGSKSGECVVTEARVLCTVDPAYVDANPEEMKGTFKFFASSDLFPTSEIDHTFVVGGYDVPTKVIPNRAYCPTGCDFGGFEGFKSGYYYTTNEEIGWTIAIPSPTGEGTDPNLAVVIEDKIDTSKYEILPGYPKLQKAGSVARDNFNQENGQFEEVTADMPEGLTISDDKTVVKFTTQPGKGSGDLGGGVRGLAGAIYKVEWQVKVLDLGDEGTYSNTGSYSLAGADAVTVKADAVRSGGSATVVGTDYGRFTLTKEVTGDEVADLPDFTVKYTTELDGVTTAKPDIVLKNGGKFVGEELFKGTTITLSEIKPSGPANVTWGEPQFILPDGTTSSTLTLNFSELNNNLGKLTKIRLVNKATVAQPTPKVSVGDYVWFDANKDGLQDASDVPLKDVTLTLTGPDGKQVTDVNGVVVAPTKTNDVGFYEFIDLPVLPAGQHYTVTITAPDGYTATTAGVGDDRAKDSSTGSAESTDLTTDGAKDYTLDFGFVKTAVIANPPVPSNPEPSTPSEPAPSNPSSSNPLTPSSSELPHTGAEGMLLTLVGSALLLLAGSGALILTRRKPRRS